MNSCPDHLAKTSFFNRRREVVFLLLLFVCLSVCFSVCVCVCVRVHCALDCLKSYKLILMKFFGSTFSRISLTFTNNQA